MRKFFFFLILVLGAGVGLFVASHESWATKVGMMALGIMFAAPFGAALTGLGRGHRRSRSGWIRGASSPGPLFKGDVPIRRWDR